MIEIKIIVIGAAIMLCGFLLMEYSEQPVNYQLGFITTCFGSSLIMVDIIGWFLLQIF